MAMIFKLPRYFFGNFILRNRLRVKIMIGLVIVVIIMIAIVINMKFVLRNSPPSDYEDVKYQEVAYVGDDQSIDAPINTYWNETTAAEKIGDYEYNMFDEAMTALPVQPIPYDLDTEFMSSREKIGAGSHKKYVGRKSISSDFVNDTIAYDSMTR